MDIEQNKKEEKKEIVKEGEKKENKNTSGYGGDKDLRFRIPKFKKAMETKYAKEWGYNKCGSTENFKITDKKTKYLRLGYTQNPRKVEMAKCGAATTKKRGKTDESQLGKTSYSQRKQEKA
jgi:methyl coenzyme M reductase alpha subunit